nr:HAD-IIA family hydrolase [Planctomonas psychrotolerans]
MFRRRTDVTPTPLDGVDAIFADLDGVVYKGDSAIPHAVESLNAAVDSGIRVGYITNNASRTDVVVADHLSALGLKVQPADVVTSPQAAASVLGTLIPAGSTVLVVGGAGLVHEVERAGFVVTRSAEDSPAAVVQGFAPDVGWMHLAEAAFALHDPSVLWVATNTDWTIPVGRGIAPGNGTLVSAVHTAVGRLPTAVAGKPEIPIFEEASRRFGAATPLFLGDRLDTDILGANRAGMASALVLTGIDQAKQVLAADASSRPTYILEDLRSLREQYPATSFTDDGATATVGRSVVSIRGDRVHVVQRGRSTIDLIRAGCAVIWNSGRAIYGLEVPESLYAPR